MKAIIIIVLVFIIGIVSFLIFTNRENTSLNPKTQETSFSNDQTGNTIDSSPQRNGTGKYLEYSPDLLSSETSSKRILYFYANWCPTCRPVDQEFKSKQNEIPERVSIIRVNYNDTDTDSNEEELARKYNISYQHTFVEIDSNENEIQKWNGGGLDQLISKLN